MKNKLSIILDDKVLKKLHDRFKDDEAAQNFAAKAIADALERCGGGQESTKQNSEGLEDYLRSGNAGSRDYGIKGQGW